MTRSAITHPSWDESLLLLWMPCWARLGSRGSRGKMHSTYFASLFLYLSPYSFFSLSFFFFLSLHLFLLPLSLWVFLSLCFFWIFLFPILFPLPPPAPSPFLLLSLLLPLPPLPPLPPLVISPSLFERLMRNNLTPASNDDIFLPWREANLTAGRTWLTGRKVSQVSAKILPA